LFGDLVSAEPQASGGYAGVSLSGDNRFSVAGYEQIADNRGALDVPERFDLLEHTVVKIDSLGWFGESGRGELHRQHPVRRETRIDAVDVQPAPDEQTRAREQNNG
jgi:hypothetical protein